MSSGVALALLASIVTVTFTALALVRMRRRFDEPVGRSGPGPSLHLEPESTRPTLVPERPAPAAERPPKPKRPEKPKKPRAEKAYVASQEDEDDVPTTLYRKDDDPDVEALLAEFDNEDGQR